MPTGTTSWKSDGVIVARAAAQAMARQDSGRATAFDFAGTGGRNTWIGTVTVPPQGGTGPHHHGSHEVAVYVVKGSGRIRWGNRLEFAADIGPGDFVYFAPFVPHQELNPDPAEALEFVVVRSDNERLAVALDLDPVEPPEMIA